jgi:hypothetical protein
LAPAGSDAGAARLVAQSLHHYATPHLGSSGKVSNLNR